LQAAGSIPPRVLKSVEWMHLHQNSEKPRKVKPSSKNFRTEWWEMATPVPEAGPVPPELEFTLRQQMFAQQSESGKTTDFSKQERFRSFKT